MTIFLGDAIDPAYTAGVSIYSLDGRSTLRPYKTFDE
jgi:hypothetical protein